MPVPMASNACGEFCGVVGAEEVIVAGGAVAHQVFGRLIGFTEDDRVDLDVGVLDVVAELLLRDCSRR